MESFHNGVHKLMNLKKEIHGEVAKGNQKGNKASEDF